MFDMIIIFFLSFCVVLMGIIVAVLLVNHVYISAYGIRYLDPKKAHQEQDDGVEEPKYVNKRHDKFKNRINDINEELQISMNDKSKGYSGRGNSPEKTFESVPDEHVTPPAKPDQDGLYDVDENAKYPSIYDSSDVEIISPEYEKMIDEYIMNGRAVRHE